MFPLTPSLRSTPSTFRGTLAGTCNADGSKGWKRQEFPGWNVDYFNAFEQVDSLTCDVWVDDPTLIVERDTFGEKKKHGHGAL